MGVTEKRTCFCCKAEYSFCARGCKENNPNETWRFLFDSEECKEAYDLWQSYRGKEIDEDDLRKLLKARDYSKILKTDTLIAQDFNKILESGKKPAVKATAKTSNETAKAKVAEKEAEKED